ncbi:hypothetical protein CFC21_097951 [Triticum aestivum]|uniref:Exocyst subunit Exo70 family protein n=2 Tax=Triticum aestivum TaxID=4565 RepID=A0A9R1LVT5_WHEAT|nr:hypothetical protein CFC21_097951 [Triticum aestivum]
MDGPAELEAAEQVVIRLDSSLASTAAAEPAAVGGEPMLFDGAGDRTEAERFLRAVDNIRRLALSSPSVVGSPRRSSGSGAAAGGGGCSAVQVTMARLEDEFRHLLSSRAFDLEIEALADLTSLCISSDRTNSVSSMDLPAVEEDDSISDCGGRRSSYRSLRSIREIDLLPDDAVADLRAIASRMAAAGYGRECAQVYASIRKPAVDASLRRLGVERLSIGDVQRLEWDALEAKIRRWIRAARAAVRGVFASERRLSFHVFHDLPISNVTVVSVVTAAPATHDTPFVEAVKGAALQLFGFAEAISIGRRSPEKLFKIIDLHDALSDLLPDVSDIFAASKAAESIYVQAVEIRSRLADAVRGILSEFENAVLRDPPKTAVPGGTVHPLTRARLAAEGNELAPCLSCLELPEHENQSPLAAHIIWIIVVLEHNLESKVSLYKDTALSHLFLMNNVHYIVHKVKDSPDLWSMIGDDYLKRLTGKFTVAATNYQRTSWLKILNCLRDEGLHVSGGFSSGISKSALRERFKSFNAAFEDAHRVQSGWFVPDTQLREELRISISEKLLPAYRSFLGRFRHHIENGKHPELYIKHSAEDLENAVNDFFEGAPPSPHNRRRSHG